MKSVTICLLAVILAFVSCAKTTPYNPDGGTVPDNSGGTTVTPATYATAVDNLSGLCYNKDSTGLWAVSDKTGVYELNFDGTTRSHPIAWQSGQGKDLEAITINAATGQLYVSSERERIIYKLTNNNTSLQSFIDLSAAYSVTDLNKGAEGLTCDQKGNLLVGNQATPWIILEFSIATATKLSQTGDLSAYFGFISDLCFDPKDGTLWVVDSKKKKVFHCTRLGVPFQSQSLPSEIDKAEALMVDSAKGCMWVGDDTTGKLYYLPIQMKNM